MEILIILLLILLNGIFAMSEIAMVSARKSRLETAAKRGDKSAKKALELAENPGKFLSTVQIGITLIGILTGIYSGEKIESDLVDLLNRSSLLSPYSKVLAVTIIVIILTFFSLVLGELVPKRIGLSMPEKVSKLLAIPMFIISKITAPFIWLLTTTSDLIIKLTGVRNISDNNVTEEEIKAIIQEGTEGGAIQEIEQDIVERVFILGDRKVASLMTHRSDLIHLRTDLSQQEIINIVNNEMHSVYPLIDENNEFAGIIRLKDLFKHIHHTPFVLKDYIREPHYVSENLMAYEALQLFMNDKLHYAVVVDEFGEMEGLITMTDLLEALVGDVSDFHGGDFSFVQRDDGSLIIDGQYPLVELMRRLDLDELASEYPFNTLSGLILHLLRHIPVTGEKLRWLNYEIEILDMDAARIDKVLLTQKEK